MVETENAGLYYLVFGLLPLVIYLEFFKPILNNAETNYLQEFVKKEIRLLLVSPLILLLAMGSINLLSFGTVPPLELLWFYFPITMWCSPGILSLPKTDLGDESIRYKVVRKAVVTGYITCQFALSLCLFGIFGPVSRYDKWYQEGEPTVFTSKDGQSVLVYMNRGLLTTFLFQHSSHIRFFIGYFVTSINSVAFFRWLVFFLAAFIDVFTNFVQFIIMSTERENYWG